MSGGHLFRGTGREFLPDFSLSRMSLVLGSIVLVLVGLYLAACTSDSRPSEIDEINAAIAAAGANWIAGETWVTQLSPEERLQLTGEYNVTNPPESGIKTPQILDEAGSGSPMAQDFPDYFSWRDHDGADWMPPVRNQTVCGGCWAFAALGVMETTMKIAWNQPATGVNLSEMHVIACDPNSNGCNGGQTYYAFRYIMTYGVPPEECFPFSQPLQKHCEDSCSNWQELVTKIDDYEEVGQSLDAIKTEVMRQPVAVSMKVYADFDSYHSGVYEHVTGDLEGYHAVVIVGWDETLGCFICRNSWGPNWGEQGYFRIKYFDSSLGRISNWVCRYYGGAEAPPAPTGAQAINQFAQGVAGAYLRQINVSWNEVPSGSTYGFNVYMSTTNSASGMSKVNTSPIFTNGFSYTMTSGDPSFVAYFAVTAMLSSGKESEFSTIVQNQDAD